MAEYLIQEETLSGIADAIRSKTGGEEPIAVGDMAAQIESITGGGGGSLPAGCYFEQLPQKLPYNYHNYHFVLNGELFLMQKPSSSATTYNIYKFENGAYTSVATGLGMAGCIYRCVMNNVLYMGNESEFSSWDGSTYKKHNNRTSCGGVFECNGELYTGSNSGYLKKWIKETDTWEQTTIGCKTAFYPFAYNGEIYEPYLRKLYKLGNGNPTEIISLSNMTGTGDGFVLADGNLYVSDSTSGSMNFYRCDINKGTYEYAFTTPYCGTYWGHYIYDGHDHFSGGNSTYKNNMRLHRVEATE